MKTYFVELSGRMFEVTVARRPGDEGKPPNPHEYRVTVKHGGDETNLLVEGFDGGALVEHQTFGMERHGDEVHVRRGAHRWRATVRDRPAPPKVGGTDRGVTRPLVVRAPIPGHVSEVSVRAGDEVAPGQRLLILEAMKMQNPVVAEHAGKVARVYVSAGDSVQADAPLVELGR